MTRPCRGSLGDRVGPEDLEELAAFADRIQRGRDDLGIPVALEGDGVRGPAGISVSRWPSKSTKFTYSQGRRLVGRDSILVRLRPRSANGCRMLNSTPGAFFMEKGRG